MNWSSPLALLLSGPLAAQSWCPPGATWTYEHSNGWTHEGFARYTYVGDTIITGQSAQIISMHAEGYDAPMQQAFSWDLGPYFTSVNGGLISLWTGSTFDTLYHLDAGIGDHWQVYVPDGCTPWLTFTVTDTGTMMIDGMPLHYLTNGGDTFVARLGSLHSQLVPWSGVVDALGGPLHCYQDIDLNYHAPSWAFGCESWVGVAGPTRTEPASIEATANGIVVRSNEAAEVIIRDATGRMVLSTRVVEGSTRVGTDPFTAGLYVVEVLNANGTVRLANAKCLKP